MLDKSKRNFIKVAGITSLCSFLDTVVAEPTGGSEVERMPALFIGHGSPMNAILENENTRAWKNIGSQLPKPRLILAVSAHWQSRGAVYVTTATSPQVIYDFRGFPEPLYQVKYDAPGAPRFVSEIKGLVDRPILGTDQWGMDHGTWLVLKHMYPDADIPVVQLSLDAHLSLADHLRLGEQLSVLRNQGVLVLGSGNIVHNLPRRRPQGFEVFSWAEEFDQTVTNRVEAGDIQALGDLQPLGSVAKLAHPTLEHYVPLLYTLGVKHKYDEVSWFNTNFYKSSISMRCLSLA